MPKFRFVVQNLYDGLPDDLPYEIDKEFPTVEEAQAEEVDHDDAICSDKPLTIWRAHCPRAFQFTGTDRSGGLDVRYIVPSDECPPINNFEITKEVETTEEVHA